MSTAGKLQSKSAAKGTFLARQISPCRRSRYFRLLVATIGCFVCRFHYVSAFSASPLLNYQCAFHPSLVMNCGLLHLRPDARCSRHECSHPQNISPFSSSLLLLHESEVRCIQSQCDALLLELASLFGRF